MIEEEELPESTLEKVKMLEGILIAVARGGSHEDRSDNNRRYNQLYNELMKDLQIKQILPEFVRIFPNISGFWPFIKQEANSYDERQKFINKTFKPLIEHLEGLDRAPSDIVISDTLWTFDEVVDADWSKALERRTTDPKGAITMARTLLETVIKRILDDLAEGYTDRDDLPKLYKKLAKVLNLAPSEHSEEPIKVILGSATNLVNGISMLRNRLSDSHGRAGPLPIRPSSHLASLAVNTAGSVAAFLVETHIENQRRAAGGS